VIELRHDQLSVETCLAAVRAAGSGGIVVFVGAVRDVSEGKHVDFLEYEAYEDMALPKLRQLVDEAKDRWPINAVAIQHRLGRLEIGDDAVVIAVACPHRAEAFAACHYMIDRLKEIVPIWKKEHGEGGSVWVGGPTLQSTASSPDRGQD
jgi:molybdopterin synthase catalytic subunit